MVNVFFPRHPLAGISFHFLRGCNQFFNNTNDGFNKERNMDGGFNKMEGINFVV